MKRVLLLLLVAAGVANAQDLVNQNFEGTGTPSGWSGSGNFDYTAVPLAGSQSLRLDSATNDSATFATVNNSEVWFSMLFKVETLPASSDTFLSFRDSGFNVIAVWAVEADGTLSCTAGGAIGDTVSALSAGTTYTVWGHYKKGSGSNAIAEVSFDTPGNPRPNSGNKHAIDSAGTSTTNLDNFFVGFGLQHPVVFDNVQMSSTDIFGSATPTASPSPTATATATFTPTATATATAAPSATPTNTPTPTPGGSATPTPSLEVSYGSAE